MKIWNTNSYTALKSLGKMVALHEFDRVCYKIQQRTTFGDKLDTVNFDFLTIDDFFYKNYIFYLLFMHLTSKNCLIISKQQNL